MNEYESTIQREHRIPTELGDVVLKQGSIPPGEILRSSSAKNIREVHPDQMYITYGAGPCIAGVVIYNGQFHIFHIPPTEFGNTIPPDFTNKIPVISEASWGVGGGLERYLKRQNDGIIYLTGPLDIGICRTLEETTIYWRNTLDKIVPPPSRF